MNLDLHILDSAEGEQGEFAKKMDTDDAATGEDLETKESEDGEDECVSCPETRTNSPMCIIVHLQKSRLLRSATTTPLPMSSDSSHQVQRATRRFAKNLSSQDALVEVSSIEELEERMLTRTRRGESSIAGETRGRGSQSVLLQSYLGSLVEERIHQAQSSGAYDGFSPRDCDGIYISSCGHAVHQSCLKDFLLALTKRKNGPREEQILDSAKIEFSCPKCLEKSKARKRLLHQILGFSHPHQAHEKIPKFCFNANFAVDTLLSLEKSYSEANFPDIQFWKMASDPVLAHDSFESLMWTLFCLPNSFLSNRKFFFSLVHIFYLVTITQGIVICCRKRNCSLPELALKEGLKDSLITDICELISDHKIHFEKIDSNYVNSSGDIMETIRRLSMPFLRRCLLLWQLNTSEDTVRNESLESVFQIPPIDTVINNDISRVKSKLWLQNFL